MCPMTGSMAARRLISRLIAGVTRRFLTCGEDPEPVARERVVAAVSLVHLISSDLYAGQGIDFLDDLRESVAP